MTAVEAFIVRRGWRAILASLALSAAVAGCRFHNYAETIGNDTTWVDSVMAQVDAGAPPEVIETSFAEPVTLKTLQDSGEPEYWDLTLDEVINYAMMNSKVLRDLGGTILSSPQIVATQYTRGLAETDPRYGMEGALSAFDAQLNALFAFQHNDRVFNNRFLGGGGNFFRQVRHDYIMELSKLTATGTRFAVRNITDYDDNNAPGNLFGSAYQTQLEGEVRQPLMQGGGLTYNRIAGPYGMPGVNNGVLIAKVNTDINSTDFNTALRNYLSDVINAYWDLYYSYRDLDSKQVALNRARETWQAYQAEAEADRRGGVSEALAREQFYRFQSELEDAIAGRVGQRTQNRNGATGGAFRGVNGVQSAERRLRLLIGIEVNERRMLRPVDEPQMAPIVFDWTSMAAESISRRPELQRQRLLVNRREMELIAAKNHLQPRFDLYGKYRLRGLGHNYAGDDERLGLRSAWGELGTAEHREWEAGVELSLPFGYRQGHAAVLNAELSLARERAVLHEQERQVLHDLSTQVAEVDRAWQQVQTNLNRYLAARDAVAALEANREVGLPVNLEQVLDAQRRFTEAQSTYHFARTEYAIALKNVHLEKGSLFEYSNVMVVETGLVKDTAPALPTIDSLGESAVLQAEHQTEKPGEATAVENAAAETPAAAPATDTLPEEGAKIRVDLGSPANTEAPSTAEATPARVSVSMTGDESAPAMPEPVKVRLDTASPGRVSLDAATAPEAAPTSASGRANLFDTPRESRLFGQ